MNPGDFEPKYSFFLAEGRPDEKTGGRGPGVNRILQKGQRNFCLFRGTIAVLQTHSDSEMASLVEEFRLARLWGGGYQIAVTPFTAFPR